MEHLLAATVLTISSIVCSIVFSHVAVKHGLCYQTLGALREWESAVKINAKSTEALCRPLEEDITNNRP
jgi:hypothetical protein